MRIALVIPTRGLVYARTIASTVLNPELPPDSLTIVVSGLPIPDSHNECIRRALATDCTHILFVEEDMEIPKDGLNLMMQEAACGSRIVVMDYKVTPTVTAVYRVKGNPLFFGFGCTMFDRTLFENEFHDPWLTDVYSLHVINSTTYEPYEEKRERYGKYDVYFGYQLHEKGIPSVVIPDIQAKHLRTASWERKEANNGMHEIHAL